MEDSLLEQEIRRLKNLKQSKSLTDQELARQAKINLLVREFKTRNMFTLPDDANEGAKKEAEKEQVLAEQIFRSYLTNHELESDTELDTLRSLVFNEVFEIRIQKELNKISAEGKYPPDRLTKQLTEIQNQKLEMKIRLGMDKEKKEDSELTGLQILTKKFDKYINAHRNEFTITCPHGELLLIRKRVTDFDSMPHPWFAGRWLFNYEILKDVKEGKLSKEDAWRYLCCASQGKEYKPAFSKQYCTDYIDYCLKHWAEITEELAVPNPDQEKGN